MGYNQASQNKNTGRSTKTKPEAKSFYASSANGCTPSW